MAYNYVEVLVSRKIRKNAPSSGKSYLSSKAEEAKQSVNK
jgi:hypothetical protein